MATRTRSPQDVAGAVERAVRRSSTGDELLESVAREVSKVVPYDGSMWFGVDPTTMLAVAPSRMEHVDEGYCQAFWNGEFQAHDANLFVDLARQPVPAATLSQATGGKPLRSARYRDFLEPQGYVDELRAVFRTGASTWGVVTLMREKGRAVFGDGDVATLSAVSATVGEALRRFAALGTVPGGSLATAPGLLLFDADGVLTSVNANARSWLAEIYGSDLDWIEMFSKPGSPDIDLALPVYPLMARARAIAAGRDDGDARARLRDRSGRWLVLHASVLDDGSGRGNIAVVVEPAKSAEVAPIVIEAYGLTPRERDVVRCIARGLSTPQIAAELFLSAHTVRDYIKAVFEKIGVGSRAELVAKLFAEHYADPFHAAMVHLS